VFGRHPAARRGGILIDGVEPNRAHVGAVGANGDSASRRWLTELSCNPDTEGQTIQTQKGTISGSDGVLHIRGTWYGAFENVLQNMGISTDFVAVRT
jgi:hypothetical protein